MASNYNNDVDNICAMGDQFKKMHIISEEWMAVDKTKNIENSSSFVSGKDHTISVKAYSAKVLSQLKPYVPFSVEELSCTTRLERWSNCNVRVIGRLLMSVDEKHFLESIDEEGGPYRILLDFNLVTSLPLPNEVAEIFGEIKITQDDGETKPFLTVLFIKNVEIKDVPTYLEAIENMRKFIPLFIKSESNSNNFDKDKNTYYHYHQLYDDDDDFAGGDDNDDDVNVITIDENYLYSNDDFNHNYNTDFLF